MRETVLVRFGAHIGHGIGRKGDVEALLIGLARGGFYADSGGDTCDDDLRNAYCF